MKKSLLRALPVLALAVAVPSWAAEEVFLKVSGSVRARYEFMDGQFRPGFDNRDDIIAIRSTLLGELRTGAWRVVGEIIDSRAYDTDAGSVLSTNEVNTFEPVQAYVQRDFSAPFGEGSSASVAVGRFTFNPGSRRLVASNDYPNAPQGYTGLRAEGRTAAQSQWQMFYLLPHQRRPGDFASLRDNDWELDYEGTNLQLWGVVVGRPGLLPGGAMGELGYVGLSEEDRGSRQTRDRDLHNFSLRTLRAAAAGKMDFELEGIYQSGHASATATPGAPRLDVSAWFAHAEAGYTRADTWKTHLSLEFDHATGDGPGADYQRFDTLYGMRTADLAPASTFAAVGRTNLQALGARVEVTPSSRLDFMAAWRLLRAAEATDSFSTTGVRDASGAAGRNAGWLIDTRLRYWIVPATLRTEVRGVWMNHGRMLRDAPNANPWGDTHYAAAALTWTF
ncbi:MAG: alginate export family protein [Pseudomonadota bacterium]|nr:alginate export family protein [Pseudomonadota bacterium]